jgi:hypothetical protein
MPSSQKDRVISAEIWLSNVRIGFAAYDPIDERLWAKVVKTVHEIDAASVKDLNARSLRRTCSHRSAQVVVYVNDGRYRSNERRSGKGFHWPARFCRKCSIVLEPLKPWEQVTSPEHGRDDVAQWHAWRSQWPRAGRPERERSVSI